MSHDSSDLNVDTAKFTRYDELKCKAIELIADGKLPPTPSREQRIDIVYGNTKIENDSITRDMVEIAVDDE